MIVTHPGCDARWSGTTVEHCAACHETFSGTEAGDAHRVGTHGVTAGRNRRRCLTVEQMQARRIRSGRLAGQPWFVSRPNAYGTEIWSRNRGENTRWGPGGDDSAGLTGTSGPGVPARGSR